MDREPNGLTVHEWTNGALGGTYRVTRQGTGVDWKTADGRWVPATNEMAWTREILRLAEENLRLRVELDNERAIAQERK